MQVAIDGPAGSGKSTVAHALAERCGLLFLDTGAMYRAVAAECRRCGINMQNDVPAMIDIARSCTIEFKNDEETQRVYINGYDVSKEIRTHEIDVLVSLVAVVPEIRDALVERQRSLGEGHDVVAEGRDIGTVVFPTADVKVFLTADASARAYRRAVQRIGKDAAIDGNVDVDKHEEAAILADIKRRDTVDSTREASPLRPADDAIIIDSSSMTLEEVISAICKLHPRLKEGAHASK